MRGKGADNVQRVVDRRITPAYAGKSLECAAIIIGLWDHPRLCGEKQKKQPAAFLTTGSPPPMRGKDS